MKLFYPLIPRTCSPECALGQKDMVSKCDKNGNPREITSLFHVSLDLDAAVNKFIKRV
jgi:hypothetical protein